MKKHIISLVILILSAAASMAQPSTVKKVGKSTFALTTYDKDGTVKSSNTFGVFISTDGEAIGLWSPFIGANRATVTTMDGSVMEVTMIMGANELYDVCKFKVNGKTAPSTIAGSPAVTGEKLWLVGVSNKKAVTKECPVAKVETFMDKYSFYLLSSDNVPDTSGQPVANDKGQIVGLMQTPNNEGGIHAIDAKYAADMKTTGLSVSSAMFQQTGIRLALPDEKEQALIMLMISAEAKDSLQQALYINDFIEKFPTSIDGYSMRAINNVNAGNFEKADQDMRLALNKVDDKAEAHAEYSRVIYQKMIFSPDTAYTKWSFDTALDEIKAAQSISQKPTYRHHEAQIEYAKGNYAKACEMFTELTKADLRHEELFLETAQCKTQLGAPDSEIISLLDSAVAACPQPLTNISAPYVLARGNEYTRIGEYRKALADFNVYDTLMLGRGSSDFYYAKFKCEVQVKQYQQALNDIAHAAYLQPKEPLYLAEMASLQLRLNLLDDAIKTAELCIRVDSGCADAYIIKGVASVHKDQKAEGLQAFEKAKELGDERAQPLIDKYK